MGGVLAIRDFNICAENSTSVPFVRAFLSPVDLFALRVDRYADAPFVLVAAIVLALPLHHQVFDFGTVEIATHDTHALAIAPIQLSIRFIEMDLFGRKSGAWWNDDLSILAVDIGALD